MSYTVLFVDDDPVITRSTHRMLRGEPYKVLTANSPQQALSLMESTEVDIVVSDEHMPEISGSEFLTIVRLRYPEVIRIILTGEANLENAVDAINNASIFRFLRKPCSPKDLKACLQSAVNAAIERRYLRESAEMMPITLESIQERQEKQERFERALRGLWMALQPIVSVPDRSIFGYEALVRTNESSVPHPGVFFGLADELERTIELERRIRSEIAALVTGTSAGVVYFVNVAPLALSDEELYRKDAPLSRVASRVVLEITERSSLKTVDSLCERVNALRALGYRIAVDDLGSGYAGLTTFTTLNPDIVKFDMDLVRDIHQSPTKTKLLRALSAVCRELNITSVAEGIETVDELNHLRKLRCSLYQGFLFSRPTKPFPTVSWPEMYEGLANGQSQRACA